jgi:hypothetical protein
MKSIGERLGIVVATCVIAAAAFAFVETAKPETAPPQQKPHNNMRRAREKAWLDEQNRAKELRWGGKRPFAWCCHRG